MLQTLKIENIAIISNLEIDFQNNMNTLSGETGAGKTIILNALNFLLGQRADKTLIKSNKDYGKVVGIFSLSKLEQDRIKPILEKYDLDIDSNQLIISRKMKLNQSSVTKINSEFVTAAILKQITTLLIDIHGQNEHQYLLDTSNQLEIIDSYNKNIKSIKNKYLEFYNKLKSIDDDIDQIGGMDPEQRLKEMEILRHEIQEIKSLELQSDTEEKVKSELHRMNNIKNIFEAIDEFENSFTNQENFNVLDLVNKSIARLDSISEYDENIKQQVDRLNSTKLELEDISYEIQNIRNNMDFDQEYYKSQDEKLDEINRLKRKHSVNVATQLLDKQDQMQKRLDTLNNSNDKLKDLKQKRKEVLEQLYKYAKDLSLTRQKTSSQLENLILTELKDLGMPNANFKVDFDLQRLNQENFEQYITKNGADKIKFLFSPNKGEPLKPLKNIISGGEMSRFMLAIKVIIAKSDNIPTMIFDEIDTGVSGDMANSISRKLARISRKHQVIVISHLPQVVSMSDHGYKVYKFIKNNKTYTTIKKLDLDELKTHVAQMIGGVNYTQNMLENAKEMIQNNKKFRTQLGDK
ncbi:MAG: DNA repair protein RecN [Candidatus Woesearchaeota archaeon]